MYLKNAKTKWMVASIVFSFLFSFSCKSNAFNLLNYTEKKIKVFWFNQGERVMSSKIVKKHETFQLSLDIKGFYMSFPSGDGCYFKPGNSFYFKIGEIKKDSEQALAAKKRFHTRYPYIIEYFAENSNTGEFIADNRRQKHFTISKLNDFQIKSYGISG